jgi:hypothetical protein
LYCTLAINDIQYQYDGTTSTFTTLSARSAPLQTVKMVMAPSDTPMINLVISGAVDTLYFSKEYTAAYARQLSSVLLADSSIAFSPIGADKVWHVVPRVGSQLKLLPFILFLIITGLFWQVIFYLC